MSSMTSLTEKKRFAKSIGYFLLEDENFTVNKRVSLVHPSGYHFTSRWDHFKGGFSRGGGRERPNRYTPYQSVKDMFEVENYKLITTYTEYRGFTRHVETLSPSGFKYRCTPEKFSRGRGCPKEHTESYRESFIREFLERGLADEYGVNPQYFVKIQNKARYFDFAIVKDGKVIAFIEYQGRQHYQPVEFWGGVDSFNKVKKGDKDKLHYCNVNGHKLIAIQYTLSNPQIIQKLREQLPYVFDSDAIGSWNLSFGRSHRFNKAEIVDYYRNHGCINTLAKFSISKTTLYRYLTRITQKRNKLKTSTITKKSNGKRNISKITTTLIMNWGD